MPLGSLVCGLLITISVNYLMDFLYLQRGLESRRCRPCREISYIRFTHIIRVPVFVFCICQSIGEVPLPVRDNNSFYYINISVI